MRARQSDEKRAEGYPRAEDRRTTASIGLRQCLRLQSVEDAARRRLQQDMGHDLEKQVQRSVHRQHALRVEHGSVTTRRVFPV